MRPAKAEQHLLYWASVLFVVQFCCSITLFHQRSIRRLFTAVSKSSMAHDLMFVAMLSVLCQMRHKRACSAINDADILNREANRESSFEQITNGKCNKSIRSCRCFRFEFCNHWRVRFHSEQCNRCMCTAQTDAHTWPFSCIVLCGHCISRLSQRHLTIVYGSPTGFRWHCSNLARAHSKRTRCWLRCYLCDFCFCFVFSFAWKASDWKLFLVVYGNETTFYR